MASTFTNVLIQIVFSTKGRAPLIVSDLAPDLHRYIEGIIHNERGEPLAVGGMPDHVHILAKVRADQSLSDLVRLIKTNSSRWAADRVSGFAWQTGYGAFSVSESQSEVVRGYIQRQEKHHQASSFQDEYRVFLQRHNLSFDETYVWG
jgi:putative transposase